MTQQELVGELAEKMLPGLIHRDWKVSTLAVLWFRDGFNANRGHVPKGENPCKGQFNRIYWDAGWDAAQAYYYAQEGGE